MIDQPLVMGIINITSDSFYSGSRARRDQVVTRAAEMVEQGAAIIDIGGQSTRPGSARIAAGTELQNVLPCIEALHLAFPELVLSVDTFYASVAREAVQAGASIVNDVSAGSIDPELLLVVASLGVPYVLMHMKGDPQTMQQQAQYGDVTLEVFDFLNQRLAALRQAGIVDVIIDPGFGFGKTIAHNFRLLQDLAYFKQLNRPLMVGLSRKATVYKSLGITPEEALNGTTVLHTIALLHGASLLRVHDVKEAAEAVRLVAALKGKEQL